MRDFCTLDVFDLKALKILFCLAHVLFVLLGLFLNKLII